MQSKCIQTFSEVEVNNVKAHADLLESPILPNKGAAGVRVRATTKAVTDLWGEPTKVEQIRSDFVRWEYDQVWFWLKAGKVDQIAVYVGYRGRTKEGIGIGSTREHVERVFGPLTWDGCWLIECPPFGIGFDFTSSWTDPLVSGIYIFRE